MNDLNEKIIELCKLNNLSLFCQSFPFEGSEIQWRAVETRKDDEGKRMVRADNGPTPEVAIAACKCAEWREVQP